MQNDRKAAVGCSREGNTVAADRLCGGNKVAAGRLRGGKSIFVLREGREMAEGSQRDGSEEDCRDGGAAAEAAADWNDEELWMSALEEAGIDWNGSLQEFSESAVMGERARALWEEGAEGLRCSLREMMAGSEVRPREAVMRTAAAFRDAFEAVNLKAQQHRFAAFASETMETLGGERECSSGEQLAEVEDEIAQLEERPQALKVARQELAEEVADQQCEEVCVTVSELAANVTSQMLEVTFSQTALVVEARVQYDEESGRSLGWGVVEFGEAADAVKAADGFDGVDLIGAQMVVQVGDQREWGESLEGEPEGELDQYDQ